ncbi:hypothetical protein D3C87_2043790 [compost metagenome]
MLQRELLCANVLAAGHAEVGPALHGGVVGDHHARALLDQPHTGDDAGPRRHALVHAFTGQLAKLHERGTFVQ